jgi:hypothetical protein
MRTDADKPAKTLRDSYLEAAIWRNESEKGAYYSVTLRRSYKDGDTRKDTTSLNSGDLLAAAHLLTRAHDAIRELRAKDRTIEPGVAP